MRSLDLEKGKIKTLFIRLVIPAVISQIITLAYNMVDRIYIGHLPENGEIALTGVGVCMPIVILLSAFAMLVGFGGGPRVSAFLGKKDRESAERMLGTCTLFAILLSVVLTVVSFLFARPLLTLFGASSSTMPYALSYFRIYVLGTIFVEISSGLAFFVTAQGHSGITMLSVFLAQV